MKGNEMMELKGIGKKLLNIFVVKVDPNNPPAPKTKNLLFIDEEEFLEIWSNRLNGCKAIFKYWVVTATAVALGATVLEVQQYYHAEKILGHSLSSINIAFVSIKSYISYFLVTPVLNILFCECRYQHMKRNCNTKTNDI